ncbi:MAG: hypothetical protein K6E22_14545 [Treponema sp.]|nr:hypothetical protein [Treponema sp.]
MENTDKNTIEKIMQSLVKQYGKELYLPENELRFKGLLFDFASDFANELKTLKVALAERIPAKLLACDDKDDSEKSRTLQHCKDTLVDGVGLMEGRVIQVLNILTFGLGWGILLEGGVEENSDVNVVKKESKSEVERLSCDDSSCTDTDEMDFNREKKIIEDEKNGAATLNLRSSIEENNSPAKVFRQSYVTDYSMWLKACGIAFSFIILVCSILASIDWDCSIDWDWIYDCFGDLQNILH